MSNNLERAVEGKQYWDIPKAQKELADLRAAAEANSRESRLFQAACASLRGQRANPNDAIIDHAREAIIDCAIRDAKALLSELSTCQEQKP